MKNLAEHDDLESTAGLRQLSSQTVAAVEAIHQVSAMGTASAPTDDATDHGTTSTWVESGIDGVASPAESNWQLLDEVLTIRDRIVNLEAAPLDAEVKHARILVLDLSNVKPHSL